MNPNINNYYQHIVCLSLILTIFDSLCPSDAVVVNIIYNGIAKWVPNEENVELGG